MKNTHLYNQILNRLNILVLIGSLAIIATLSYEILVLGHYQPKSQISLNTQLVVCIIFILDFIVRWFISPQKVHFVLNNIILLIFSIPYMNIIHHYQIPIPNEIHYLLGFVPLLRGGYGLIMITRWFTRRNATSIMFSYLSIITATTYFTSLIFFIAEREINPNVKNYGDALWWACMNLATVGSNIVAITPIGKILSVFIAGSGMMMFPIFTVYITDKVINIHSTNKSDKTNQTTN